MKEIPFQFSYSGNTLIERQGNVGQNMYSFPFDAFRAKKIYIHLQYRFGPATHLRTKNAAYIVERKRFRPTFFERSTQDVICIKIAKNVKFVNMLGPSLVS